MKKRDLFNFGERSNRRRKEVSKYLIDTSNLALQCSPIDFGVPLHGGKRTSEEQNELYKDGYSKADGFKKLSFHQKEDNEGKGLALDLVPYVSGKGFSYKAEGRFAIIACLMLEAFQELQEKGKIPKNLYLHWGGFWSKKNEIGLGWDLPHYEIRDFEQKIKV